MAGANVEVLREENVACPCCGKALYRRALLRRSGGDAIWLTTPESPRMQKDHDGYFLKCDYCSKRISMTETPSGRTFQISLDQRCDKTLP